MKNQWTYAGEPVILTPNQERQALSAMATFGQFVQTDGSVRIVDMYPEVNKRLESASPEERLSLGRHLCDMVRLDRQSRMKELNRIAKSWVNDQLSEIERLLP